MKWLKRLILWYFAFVLIKTFLSYFVPSPSGFSDAYFYMEMAKSFFYDFNFEAGSYQPLYPILISLSYLFKNPVTIYMVIKILNTLISSLIIFPAWLLSKEFMTKRRALRISILVSLIPPIFSFSPYVMSENLFFPLFLSSIYFIYKSLVYQHSRWHVLGGIFVGLTILAKITGIALIFSLIATWFIDVFYLNHKKNLKKKTVLLFFLLITLSPLLIKNFAAYGFSLSGLFGRHSAAVTQAVSTTYPLVKIIPRFFLILGYILLSSLVIYFISLLSLFKSLKKNHRLFILSSISLLSIFPLILIQINHGIYFDAFLFPGLGGRIIGRYLAAGFPAIFILGSIAMIKKNRIPKTYLFLTSLILIFASNLVFIPLFPLNNLSLTYMGIFTYLLTPFLSSYKLLILFAIIFGSLPFISYTIYKKLNFQQLTSLTILFFILLGLVNYSVIAYNSYAYWYKGDQMQLGLWFNEYDQGKSNLLFDERDTGKKMWKLNQSILCDANFCPMTIWTTNKFKIGNPLNPPKDFKIDYIVSKHKLNLPIVQERGGIYIYKTK